MYDFNEKTLLYYVSRFHSDKDFIDKALIDFPDKGRTIFKGSKLAFDSYEKEHWYTDDYHSNEDEKIVMGYIPRRLGFFEKLKFWK